LSRKGLSRGDVVLTRFPFTDLKGSALRPAVIVSEGEIGDDVVLVAISSAVRGGRVPTDLPVDKTHPEFTLTGLRLPSVVRTHKLATVERAVVVRRMGRLGPGLQKELDELLRRALSLA
jgi:mRNA interferase MazF